VSELGAQRLLDRYDYTIVLEKVLNAPAPYPAAVVRRFRAAFVPLIHTRSPIAYRVILALSITPRKVNELLSAASSAADAPWTTFRAADRENLLTTNDSDHPVFIVGARMCAWPSRRCPASSHLGRFAMKSRACASSWACRSSRCSRLVNPRWKRPDGRKRRSRGLIPRAVAN